MYSYEDFRAIPLDDRLMRDFCKARDQVFRLCDLAGSFNMMAAIDGLSGDDWTMMSFIDRLVDWGEIREITGPEVAGQDRVFVRVCASA